MTSQTYVRFVASEPRGKRQRRLPQSTPNSAHAEKQNVRPQKKKTKISAVHYYKVNVCVEVYFDALAVAVRPAGKGLYVPVSID